MATDTYVIEGSFTSGGNGILYDLQLPIQTVQTSPGGQIASTSTQPSLVKLEVYNYTKWGTDTNSIKMEWLKGMANGSALITTRGTTDLSSTLETTNGFTIVNDTPRYGVEITAITNANPGVTTFRGPGMNPGQGIPNWQTGDKGIFRGASGSSLWNAINGIEYTITKVDANSFSFGVDTTTFGTYTASSGLFYRTYSVSGQPIPPLNVANVGVRFGSAVIGADGDVLYFVATISDDYRPLGDIGA